MASRHLYGIVDENGNIISGSGGFRSQKIDRGMYVIEFDSPFNSLPVPVCTIFGHPWRTFNMSPAVLNDISPYHFICLTSTPDQPEDCGFSFSIFGD